MISSSKLQFGVLPHKSEPEFNKNQGAYPAKDKNDVYYSLSDSCAIKEEYYSLKEGNDGWKIKKDVLQQYLVSRRAIYDNYPKYKEQDTLHVDILDFNKHNQYVTSEEKTSPHELDPVFQYSVKAAKFTAGCLKDNKGDNGMPLKAYLAKAGNKIQVGFVQFHALTIDDQEYVYIAELAVDPAYQRKGIGTRLIEMVLDSADQSKTPYLILTRSFNANAKALYEKLGFQQMSGAAGEKLVMGCGYVPEKYIALLKA
jgi:ribosomal protein S18 acetylase RimI-like enzyme